MWCGLVDFGEGVAGEFDVVAVGFEFEVGVVLGDGFLVLLELLGGGGESEVAFGVVGEEADGVLGAVVGAEKVAGGEVEVGDFKVFGEAVVGVFDLGELVAAAGGGGAGGAFVFEGRCGVVGGGGGARRGR